MIGPAGLAFYKAHTGRSNSGISQPFPAGSPKCYRRVDRVRPFHNTRRHIKLYRINRYTELIVFTAQPEKN
jgi:hypothetical protein